jgi:hypothetical protein
MARTLKYKKQVSHEITLLNTQLRKYAEVFGQDSDVYQNAVNRVKGAVGEFTYVNKGGVLQISKGNAAISTLKLQQLKGTRLGMPTAKQLIEASKKEIADKHFVRVGKVDYTSKELKEEVKTITDEYAILRMKAKEKVKAFQNENGRIEYSADFEEFFKGGGIKSYVDLARIIEQMEDEVDAQVQSRQANINQYEQDYDKGKAML